jgi:hypothetical protein
MWIGQVSKLELKEAGRWSVAFFASTPESHASFYPVCKIRDLVDEVKESIDPQLIDTGTINYIGLENIISLTGELINFEACKAGSIKSRSKTFIKGDVLFGRLRPELNKVYLAEELVSPGICSNEFIVLRAKSAKIDPRYLRYALASPYVSQYAKKLRTGASLPRMSSKDLLDLTIPVPPAEIQEKIADELSALDARVRAVRVEIQSLPGMTLAAFANDLRDGGDSLGALIGDQSNSRRSSL